MSSRASPLASLLLVKAGLVFLGIQLLEFSFEWVLIWLYFARVLTNNIMIVTQKKYNDCHDDLFKSHLIVCLLILPLLEIY